MSIDKKVEKVDVTAETLDRPLTWFRAAAPFYATVEEHESQKTSEVAAFWVLADTPEEALGNIQRSHTVSRLQTPGRFGRSSCFNRS